MMIMMNKKNLGLVAVSFALVGSLAAEQMQKNVQPAASSHAKAKKDMTVEYVDALAAMRESDEGKRITSEIETKRRKMAEELQKIEKQLMQSAKATQEKWSTMSEEAREKTQREMAKAERDYKMKAQEYEEELQREMQKATEKLSKELDEAVAQYAQESKIDVVIDRVTGRVVYSVVDQEPTQKITELMNKNCKQTVVAEGNKKSAGTTVAKTDKKSMIS